MDTSDPNIKFNSQGKCDYCENYNSNIEPEWNHGSNKGEELNSLISKVKIDSKNSEYDCILGLSGGLDSAYLAHFCVKEMKLNPLLLHVDVGWNTQESVRNIEKIVDGLGLDLYTHVVHWPSMRSLQRAFFKAGLPDLDYPQDIAYISTLYQYAREFKIKYVFNGGNFSTECCREPEEWGGYLGVDKWFVNSVFNDFGDGSIEQFPLVDVLYYKIVMKHIYGVRSVYPLNYTRYGREIAQSTLSEKYGCETFKHKHHESIFTRFYEDYWLPKRFGFEKRRAHLSSLVMTRQLDREDALRQMQNSVMSPDQHLKDAEYVRKKLGFSNDEFEELFNAPKRSYSDFKNKRNIIMTGARILRLLGLESRLFR
jgi:putative aminotransferase